MTQEQRFLLDTLWVLAQKTRTTLRDSDSQKIKDHMAYLAGELEALVQLYRQGMGAS